jgi:hypothetical protein
VAPLVRAAPSDSARGFGRVVLQRGAPFALAFGLFLAIWGVKLAVIDRFGSDLPYWDQWAKEGDLLLTPWFENHTLWRNLLLPHNEHRIAPTLALNLALVVGGGQWDARVQCIAGAALHAAIAAGLLLWGLRHLSRGWAIAAGGVLLLSTGAPIVWENLLGGFQSQFSFLTGFSLLALHGLLAAPALSWRWWVGFGSGLLALVSMGSGVLVVAPLLAVIALRGSDGRPARRDLVITLGAVLALGGIGASLHVTAPWHDSLRAASPGVFLEYWVRTLAWPRPGSPWLALLIWLPWVVLAVDRGRRRRSVPHAAARPADFVLAAGGWVLLQIAAVSFSRAGAGGYPANRYGDIAALGLPVSFLALALLAARLRPALAWALGAVWLLLVGTGVGIAAQESLAGPLPAKLAESRAFERHVQAFVATDDYAAFALQALPFPSPDWLARILRRADIRAILPASVRAPVPLAGFALDPTPPAPPLAHRRTKTVAIVGEWRSAPVPPGDGWWKIETSGPAFSPPRALSPPGASVGPRPAVLQYVALAPDAASGGRPAGVAASRAPMADTWRAAYVRAGSTPGHLIARIANADRWLALSEPIAVSALSHRARQGAKLGLWFGGAGAVLLLSVAAGMILENAVGHRGHRGKP